MSIDGGSTYTEIAVPPPGGDAQSIVAASTTTLFVTAVSGASIVYRTSGTDASWGTAVYFGDGGIGITDFGFTDLTHGAFIHGSGVVQEANEDIAGGYANDVQGKIGTLYLTNDGGASWSDVPIPT